MNNPTIPATVARLRQTFDSGKTRPIEWRLAQLAEIERAMRDHETRLRRGAAEGSRQVPLRGGHDRDELRGGGVEVRAQAPAELDAAHQRADADDGPAGAQLHRAGAEGRGADHRAVELPAVHGRRAARGRRGRRQLRGHEAVRDHHAHVDRAGRHPAALPRQGCVRGRRGRRPGDDGTARAEVRPHPLHRQREGGAHRDDGGCEEPDAGHARTRRQEPVHHRQERRYRSGGVPHRLGQVHQRGPDLRCAGPRARAPRRWRRSSSTRSPAGSRISTARTPRRARTTAASPASATRRGSPSCSKARRSITVGAWTWQGATSSRPSCSTRRSTRR